MVAVIGAIAAISVAFWNSRGDFAELRQLKSMNEVIATMPEGKHKEMFETARDALSVRVASRVVFAPGRRRRIWLIVLAIAILGATAAVIVLISPYVPDWLQTGDVTGWAAIFLSAIAAAIALVSNQAITTARAAKERERATARLRAMERFLSVKWDK